MEESNEGQKSALETLRESIKKRNDIYNIARATEHFGAEVLNKEKVFELLDIPEVKEPSSIAEFDLERYQQLTRKVDIIYNNYLVSKQEFVQASDNMAEQLKLLAKTLDETLHEGTKPRWS